MKHQHPLYEMVVQQLARDITKARMQGDMVRPLDKGMKEVRYRFGFEDQIPEQQRHEIRQQQHQKDIPGPVDGTPILIHITDEMFDDALEIADRLQPLAVL